MTVENPDVNAVPPSSTEPVVNTPAPDTQVETTPQPETPTPAPTVNSDVDEMGVPWKNRALEKERKLNELIEKLPTMLDEKLSALSQNNQQRKYTVEELEQFASSTDNAMNAQWARSEIRKLEREEQANVVKTELSKWQKQQQDDMKRQQSLAYVQSQYPDAFVKNQAGQIVGWNQNHPITQQIGQVMSDPRFAQDPEGLIAASDIAFARYSRGQLGTSQLTQQKLKEEVKDLQRRTLVEGGTRQNVQAAPTYKVAIDKAKQTGSVRDVAAALAEMAKARRASQE